MRLFMDDLQHAFYEASSWDIDNSYSTLTSTAQSLLFFDTPKGVRLHVSALSSPNFASSYTLGSVGLVDGAISYLYTSLALSRPSWSSATDLRKLVPGYRHVRELKSPAERRNEIFRRIASDRKDTLLYGRLYLPGSSLEGMYMRRLSPTRLLKLACVSDSTLATGGTILASLQQDAGKYSSEYLFSTDSALLGVRGLYNFGYDPRKTASSTEQLNGRFSAGAEFYYGMLNKSGGLSTGIRFTTLAKHSGFPYTMTLTLNPLMGNISSTYAVKAGRNIALCSQFDFNFYSYESDLRLGCEVWRKKEQPDTRWVEKMLRPGWKQVPAEDRGVLKLRWDQNWQVGVLWEGRLREIMCSLGVSLDLQKREQIFRAVGVELQYSS